MNTMALINPLHLIIGRRFHGKALFFSQDLRQKGIEILCSGAQNHLLFLHKDSPSSSQIFLQCPSQKIFSLHFGGFQNLLLILTHGSPHRFRNGGVRHLFLGNSGFSFKKIYKTGFLFLIADRKNVSLLIGNKVTASFLPFNIPFLLQKCQCMFHRNQGNALFLGKIAFGGQAFRKAVATFHNVLPHFPVKLHVLFHLSLLSFLMNA